MKAIFALVMAVLLLISFVACSNNTKDTNTSPTATPATGGTGSNESAAPDPAKVKDPVTLTFWGAQMAGNSPSGVQTDPVAKLIEQELNIKMDMETHPSDEKLAVVLASNDLMDIMLVDKKYVTQMQSLVLDLEPLIEANAPDIKSTVNPEVFNFSKKYLGNGKLLFLPDNISRENAVPDQVWGGVYTRWDFYKELGYPEITSTDEYLNVVSQMLEKHPTNEDGKKNFGFSIWFDWGPYTQTDTLHANHEGKVPFGGIIAVTETDRDTLARTNKYLNPDSVFWKGVDFWYKANQKNLLDPESFTQNYEQALQKYQANRVLASVISFATASASSYYTNQQIFDKGFLGPIPITGSKAYQKGIIPYGNNYVYAIDASSEHADRAMELINWFYSTHGCMTVQNGVEGAYWTNENGKFAYTQAYYTDVQDPDAGEKFGFRKYSNFIGMYPDALIPGTQDPIDLKNTREELKAVALKPENALIKEALDYYKVETQADILPKGSSYVITNIANFTGFLPATEPDDIVLIDQKIDNYLKQAVPKIILAKNDDDFNAQKAKMIDDIKNMGVEQVYKFWDDAIQKAVDDYNALH